MQVLLKVIFTITYIADVIFLKGLFFQKIQEKGLQGIHLFSDSSHFKERRFFHSDETTIESWIYFFSLHCKYYSVTDIYQQVTRIGGGKFAEVFYSNHKQSNNPCALKKIDKQKLTPKEKQFLRDEIQIISMIKHPYIVEM